MRKLFIFISMYRKQNHVKLITRHIWENYMEQCEDVRHTLGMKNYMSKERKPLNESLEQQGESWFSLYTDVW